MTYSRRLLTIALPIMAQQFISSSLNLVGGLMIGQLGETAVAAVGLSNQVFFVMALFLFGINSGAAIFVAQLWGKRDVPSIHRVQGLGLLMSLVAAAIFFAAAVLLPRQTLAIYTADPAVIAEGMRYLRIIGWSYLFTGVTYSFATTLRSTGDVRTPLVVSTAALALTALLSYVLIFGKLGLPVMGIAGAGLATAIARVLETLGLVGLTYLRRSPVAARPADLFGFDRGFARSVLARALPVAFNELLWSLGITSYNAIYAHIGTTAIAAMNIASTMENLAFVVFIGISDATAILVGHEIGGGNQEEAFRIARRSLLIGMAGGLLMGVALYSLSGVILSLYKVAPLVTEYARRVLLVMAAGLWVRVGNMTLFVGIFRAGGDTRFGFLLDALTIWFVGVPLAYAGAFLFRLPIYWVYPLVLAEEAVKWVVAMFRFASRKWLHNVTEIGAG